MIEALDRANNLRDRVRELKDFLFTIDPIQGRDDRNSVALKVRTRKEFSLFGSRFYGIGISVNELRIPQPLVEKLKEEARIELRMLEKELEGMFNQATGKEVSE